MPQCLRLVFGAVSGFDVVDLKSVETVPLADTHAHAATFHRKSDYTGTGSTLSHLSMRLCLE